MKKTVKKIKLASEKLGKIIFKPFKKTVDTIYEALVDVFELDFSNGEEW